MTDEAENTNESPSNDNVVVDNVTEQPQENQQPSKPAGYDPVDVETSTPEQIKERLDYLYRQVKDTKREKAQSERERREERQILQEQSRLIAELTQGYNGVINHLQDKTITDTEESLNRQMQEAWAKGDDKAWIAAQNRLTDLRVEKRLLAEKRPKEIKQPQQQNPVYRSAAEIAREASNEGELSETDYRTVDAWQSEKDENGQPLRPWAFDGNPQYRDALVEMQAILNSSKFQNAPYEQKLAELDRRMGMAKRTGGQNVMSANLTGGKKTARVTLSPDIERMVLRTKWGGSKHKTDAERLDAYRKQIANVKQSKGARA